MGYYLTFIHMYTAVPLCCLGFTTLMPHACMHVKSGWKFKIPEKALWPLLVNEAQFE